MSWRRALRVGVRALLALPVVASAQPREIPAGPLTLEALMQRMASTTGVRAAFSEQRDLALLEEPLVIEGELVFVPPARMSRITTRPGASVLVIDGARLSYTDEAGGSHVDLAGNRVARAMVENLLVLFSGDLEALRERYRVEFDADGLRWRIALVPKGPPLSPLIASVAMRGVGPALEELVVREQDGDRTTTRFQAVQTDVRFSPEELARLFPRNPILPPPP